MDYSLFCITQPGASLMHVKVKDDIESGPAWWHPLLILAIRRQKQEVSLRLDYSTSGAPEVRTT